METRYTYPLRPEADLLLDILNARSPCFDQSLDVERFVTLAKLHDLAPLVFCRLQHHNHPFSKKASPLLRSGYLSSLMMNLKFWNEFLKINEAFQQSGIDMVPLKGMDILVRFYPTFDLRSMVDIDIVVKESQFAQAEKILSDLHYLKRLDGLKEGYWRDKQCHIAFFKNGVLVEVHWGLDFKRGHRAILPQLWERTRQLDFEHYKIDIFSPEDALFSFALHLRRFGNILSLKQVLDVARIIKDYPGFDWGYVLKEAAQGRMKATLYFILMQVKLFTKTKIPSEVFRKLGIPAWQKVRIRNFLLKRTFQIEPALKKDYLSAHFLLYDNLCEPALYIINIPYEQFCKFYGLKPYTHKASLIYKLRLIYMLISLFIKKKRRVHCSN